MNVREVKPTDGQMSQQDRDTLAESNDVPELLDESDMYFVGDRADEDDVDGMSSLSADEEDESDAEVDNDALAGMSDGE